VFFAKNKLKELHSVALSLTIHLLCHVYDRLCCLSNVKLSWQRHW